MAPARASTGAVPLPMSANFSLRKLTKELGKDIVPLMDVRNDTREKVQNLDAKGLSVREISAILNLTTQAVYYQIRKIRKAEETRKSA